jgi:hypothetical protein
VSHRQVGAAIGAAGALAIGAVALTDSAPSLTADTLARSMTQRLTIAEGDTTCRHLAGRDWRCAVFVGSDGARYRVRVGDDKCWQARVIRPSGSFPARRSGCVR